MPGTTNISSRIRTAVSDDHMETLATRIFEKGGLIATFMVSEYGSRNEALKKAKGYQIRWGTFKARCRKREFAAHKSLGHDVSALSYKGAYDNIEAQLHDCSEWFEVRFILAKNLYKEIVLTDLEGNPIEL